MGCLLCNGLFSDASLSLSLSVLSQDDMGSDHLKYTAACSLLTKILQEQACKEVRETTQSTRIMHGIGSGVGYMS